MTEPTPAYRAFRSKDTAKFEEFFRQKHVRYGVAAGAVILVMGIGYKLLMPHTGKNANLPALNDLVASSTTTEKADRAKIDSLLEDVKTIKSDLEAGKTKLTAATQLIDDQNKKITEIESRLDRQSTDLKEKSDAAAKKAADDARFAEANKTFDIYSLEILKLTPDALILVDKGQRVTVFPGQALPSGVIFMSYDAKSKILKTSAGMFQVTK